MSALPVKGTLDSAVARVKMFLRCPVLLLIIEILHDLVKTSYTKSI